MSAKAKSRLTPEQQKATMTRVLQKIGPYGFFVGCSLIVAAVSVAAQLYIPILCGNAIDLMLGKGTVDFAGVMRIVVQIVVVAVIAAFAQWLLSVCNNRITFSVSRDLRNAALRKIQTLPLSYLDSHPSGDIVSRMVADVDTFADGLLMGFTQLFSGVLTCFATIIPIFGTALIWLPLAGYMALTGDWGPAIGLLLYGGLVVTHVDNVVRFIMQKKMADTHPLVTIFGVFIGLSLFGFMGVIFGPLMLEMFVFCVNIFKKKYLDGTSYKQLFVPEQDIQA